MRVQSLQSYPTLHDPMDCSLPGSSVHGDSPGKHAGQENEVQKSKTTFPQLLSEEAENLRQSRNLIKISDSRDLTKAQTKAQT